MMAQSAILVGSTPFLALDGNVPNVFPMIYVPFVITRTSTILDIDFIVLQQWETKKSYWSAGGKAKKFPFAVYFRGPVLFGVSIGLGKIKMAETEGVAKSRKFKIGLRQVQDLLLT